MRGFFIGSPEAMGMEPEDEPAPDGPHVHDWVPTGRTAQDGDGGTITEYRCTDPRCGETAID